jgi:type IV pilus assembly protein PilY1
VIYVGANDGMLHGFDAETGKEVVAYIPHGIASVEADAGMHYLLDKNYEHRYYVDGSPVAADAKINGVWKTVLLSGLGAGGESVFALDITDPTQLTEANAANTVLWEFTADDMGFTFAQPKVAKMNDGTWVAIIGNGYNNTADGQSKIFILNLATGALIKKFETGVGSSGASPCADCNGMSTATTFDVDGNGTADYIYAGDVQGNVWAINVTSDKQSEWVFDSEVTYGDDGQIISYSGGLTEPLFTTDGNAPITTELAAAPLYRQIQENNHYPGILVMFGTGQFLAHGDHRSARTEKFYSVLHSHGQYGLSTATPGDFVQREITSTTITVDGESEGARKIEADPGEEYIAYDKDPTERQYGWYVDLPASGERVIHPPKVVGDYVLFNTFYPHSSNVCSAGASGYLMAANYRNGLAPDEILDFNRDGVIDEGDKGYAGIEIDDAPAGITPLGNDGVGSTDFEGLDIILMDMMGRQPLRSSWTDVR